MFLGLWLRLGLRGLVFVGQFKLLGEGCWDFSVVIYVELSLVQICNQSFGSRVEKMGRVVK